jgi:LysM repeat protein
MNKEDPYRDQAERLRQRIERKPVPVDKKEEMSPRANLHRQRKKKTNWKLKYPIIRFLVLCFILLPVSIFGVKAYLDDQKIGGAEKTEGDSSGYETIDFENKDLTEESESPELDNEIIEETEEQSSPKQIEITTDPVLQSNVTPDVKTPNVEDSTDDVKSQSQTVEVTGTTAEEKQQVIYHTVLPKETLYRIAMKYYHSQAGIDIIKRNNHITGNEIHTGQVLEIKDTPK